MSAAKVLTPHDLLLRIQRWQEAGESVVWTNGCFDLLHVGHVRSRKAARQLGNVLIVGVVNSADSCAGSDS